jgi:hypothetical protein
MFIQKARNIVNTVIHLLVSNFHGADRYNDPAIVLSIVLRYLCSSELLNCHFDLRRLQLLREKMIQCPCGYLETLIFPVLSTPAQSRQLTAPRPADRQLSETCEGCTFQSHPNGLVTKRVQ